MSQIEVPKLVSHANIGVLAGHISAPKLVIYAMLVPGESGEDDSGRQGHVYGQRIGGR